MPLDLEKRLKGTRSKAIFQELLTNSLHFPLANIILERSNLRRNTLCRANFITPNFVIPATLLGGNPARNCLKSWMPDKSIRA
jgi:hypothetical protein